MMIPSFRQMVALTIGSAGFLLQGCATLSHGTTQAVSFDSTPPGARVILVPSGIVATTPATVSLPRKQAHTARFELDGYAPTHVYLDRTLSDELEENILFGGVLGMMIDIESGAAFSLSPESLTVNLERITPPPAFQK